jgi:hypothetical protein
MPGITGLILALLVGRFLQTQRSIVPWYSLSRLMFLSCFALTGILTLLVDEKFLIIATLAIWAFATLPQTALNVAFSVVMNAVAGPEGGMRCQPSLGDHYDWRCWHIPCDA